MIRPERPEDAEAIASLTSAAFAGAAHSDGNEAQIVAGLREAGVLPLSLVTQRDGQLIGHIAFSPVQIGDCDAGWYGLGPMSVAPECQGQGIGSALVEAGLHRLREASAQGVVVLGDPAFYRRFGFRAGLGPHFAGVPESYFMALAFTASVPEGPVSYHPAFFV